ncbi:MAG: hypothetical protein O2887_08395 [Bacteroidetes bacterium]|nr:hypothetical protein [Bacteroidota bacterium]MDA1120497.1 hypothetical protein [Bacteroidota bacterium]
MIKKPFQSISIVSIIGLFLFFSCEESPEPIRISTFRVNATPPIGSPVAYAPARQILDSLSARGIVILSDEKPIVICVVDWLGIANEGLEKWKENIAIAANTTPNRVSVHALHQHDGVRGDFTTAGILEEYGLGGTRYDIPFLNKVIQNVANAVSASLESAKPVTHLGFGKAKVEKVASNRRILGDDGKVAIIRWSKSTDSLAIAAPEGLIDPWLKSVSFWDGDNPIAVLTYYATHPQSYYGEGDVTSEFVGIAREARQKTLEGLPHIHLNGASGNVAAGKYNDGSVEMRPILANRMELAMKKAWENTQKTPLSSENLEWKSIEVLLPMGEHLVEDDLKAILSSDSSSDAKFIAAKHLAWLLHTKAGKKANVSVLHLDKVWLLNLPGELFIEYQIAAQELRPGEEVCTAAYEEYGAGYIGTEIAYSQGGYETSERASRVSPQVEGVLMKAIREILK